MKFSIKDFVFFDRPERGFGVFSPIYIETSARGIGCNVIMQEIINSVFFKKFQSLLEGLWNEISLKYSRKAIWKLVDVCGAFSNWGLLITMLWGSN